MGYKMISAEEMEMVAQYVGCYPEEFDERTVLITTEDTPQFYEPFPWLNRGEGPTLYMNSPCPCDVSEAEWTLFKHRVGRLHGIKPLDNERTVKAVLRAVERMHLPAEKTEYIRTVIGITPEQIAADPEISFMDDAFPTIEYVAAHISDYCMNEWDRRLLAPALLKMKEGPVRMRYTNVSFAESYGIPVSVAEHVIDAVLGSQTVLSKEEEVWLRCVLDAQESMILSWQDGTRLSEMMERIDHEWAQNEEEAYDNAAQAYMETKDRHAEKQEAFCAAHRLSYSMFWRVWNKKYPRPCAHRKSKKLKDFLDD